MSEQTTTWESALVYDASRTFVSRDSVSSAIATLTARCEALEKERHQLAKAIAPTYDTVEDRDLFTLDELVKTARNHRELTDERCEALEKEKADERTARNRAFNNWQTAELRCEALIAERDEAWIAARDYADRLQALRSRCQHLEQAVTGLLAELPELWGDNVRNGKLTLSVSEDGVFAALASLLPEKDKV